jgi:transposase InsO family protein
MIQLIQPGEEHSESLSRVRVRRLMKRQALEARSQRKFKATTHSNHDLPVAPSRLNPEFQVED